MIYFFLFKDESLDVCPTTELMVGLAVRKAAGNEFIDAVILVLIKGNLTLSGEIVTEDSLRENLPSLLVEGALEVDKFVDDDSQ